MTDVLVRGVSEMAWLESTSALNGWGSPAASICGAASPRMRTTTTDTSPLPISSAQQR